MTPGTRFRLVIAIAVLALAGLAAGLGMKFPWSDAVGGESLAVTVVGFSVALWQIARSTAAVEAARAAVVQTEAKVAGNHLLSLIPEMEKIEQSIDDAATNQQARQLIDGLVSARRMANEIAGLLAVRTGPKKELTDRLTRLATACTSTKSTLISNSNGDLLTTSKKVREALGGVCGDLARYASELRSTGEIAR